MDPALQELLASGEASDEVEIVVRLTDGAEPPPLLRLISRFGPVATARIERAAIWQVYGHPAIRSIKAPRWLVGEDQDGLLISPEDAADIDLLPTDRRRPELPFRGRDVVIGVVDWGCDFAHPDFVDESGQSRLIALWDQRHPRGDGNRYGYGRVLRQAALSAALKADHPYLAVRYHPARSDSGIGAHGTHVLGIAAGNGRGGGPLGIAPEAALVFVHLGKPGWEKSPLGDSGHLLDAIHFIAGEAGERPLVINLSIGRHGGPHDGSTLVEQAIDWLVRSRPGTAVVQSTGNYFARDVHCTGRLWNGASEVIPFRMRPGDTTPNEIEVWYPGSDEFTVELLAPGGRVVASAALGSRAAIDVDGVRVGTLYHRAHDPNNGDHHIHLFQYPSAPAGEWQLRLSGKDVADGCYHAWIERDPGCAVCQALFLPEHVERRWTTGSICNSLHTIAVGAYDGHDPAHRLAPFSSCGPTRDGRPRPLLLAPGVRVLAARSRPRHGDGPLLTRMSGTSMAAPHVTGTLALMLEAGGRLDSATLRRALFDTLQTPSLHAALDRERAGFGLLDSAAAVRRAAELAGRTVTDDTAATPTGTGEIGAVSRPEAAPPEAAPAAVTELSIPESTSESEEPVMSPDCCGAACASCEHCASNECATCPCCHADVATATEETPAIQVVPSPLARSTPEVDESAAGVDIGEDELPALQVVPSPLAGLGTATQPAHEDLDVAVADVEHEAARYAEVGAETFAHPVEAAEALVEAGVDDSTEFVAQTLAAAGRHWPEGCSVRALFDDLSQRSASAQRLRKERLFELVGRPNRPLAMPLAAGDLVIRRGDGGFASAAFVAHPWLYREHEARGQGLYIESSWPGWYVHVVEAGARPRRGQTRVARRICRADGSLLPNILIVRPRSIAEQWPDEAVEAAADPNVRWLQTALNRVINAGLVADGVSGPATRDAVRRYQAMRGLTADGIAGPRTLAALRTDYAAAATPGYPPQPAEPPYAPPQPGYPPPPAYSSCRRIDGFGYDSSTLGPDQLAAVAALAQTLVAGGVRRLSLTGHASPEGTTTYNHALGQRRAEAVAVALRGAIERIRPGYAAQLQIELRSAGETQPLPGYAGASRRVEVCYGEVRPQPPAPPRPAPPQPRPQPPRPQPPAPPRVYVRYDAASAQGQAMLLRYEEAVRRMMALPERDPRSWTFQWYTHAVRSDRTRDAELNRVFGSAATPARQLAARMWNTCRAHFDNRELLFFLPWHRMYVYYFERICRSVLEDDSFTLPYWNYSSGSAVLPARCRDPRSPLFRADRNAGVNRGDAIDEGMPRGTVSAERALARRNYVTRGNDEGFNEFIDEDPHGVVHGLVGNDRGMGRVPWAANDPIFWLHHCNIDRIWASWNAAGRRNPTDAAFLDRRFTFADENGREVTATVRDFVDIGARGYRYERLENMPAAAAEAIEAEPAQTRSSAMARRHSIAPTGGIPLGGQAIKVNLGSAQREAESDEAGSPGRRTYLVLRNYRANVTPGIVYHVYLALPPGTRGEAAQRHYVGPLSFFNAVPVPGHVGQFTGKTHRFDVTALAQRLRTAGLLGANPSVTIAPAGEPAAAAQPVIGEISLVEE